MSDTAGAAAAAAAAAAVVDDNNDDDPLADGSDDTAAVEDVDLGDDSTAGGVVDSVDELIAQAESLMHDLGDKSALTPSDDAVPDSASRKASLAVEPTFSNEFSIGDDDDDDYDDDDESGVVVGASTTPVVDVAVDDHPLSLSAMQTTTTTTTSAGTNQEGSSTMNQTFMIGDGGGGVAGPNSQINNMNPAVTMDAFKQQTSRFASNLASMAQRGMAQVAAATAPTQPVHVIGAPPGGVVNGGRMMPPQQQQQQQSPSSFASNIYGGGHGGAHGSNSFVASLAARTQQQQQQQQQQHQQQQYQQPPQPSPMSNGISSPTSSAMVGGATGATPSLSQEEKSKLIQDHVGDLLAGERVIMFLANLLHVGDTSGVSYSASSAQSHDGGMWCCVMTYYRLIFFSTRPVTSCKIEPPQGWDPACWPDAPSVSKRLVEMPLASMGKVEKTVYQAGGNSYMGLVIQGKDCGRVMRFTTPSYADTGRAYESLNTYAFPGRRNIGYLFAFESKRAQVMASIQTDPATGQQRITLPPTPRRFDPMTEYPRILQATTITQSPWAVYTALNSTYMLSPSYPSVLIGPASLDETKPENQSVIRQCAAFRSEQRLPCLTWCGPGGSSIWRSSQPKVGLQGNRSTSDELYLKHISESARGANAMADPPPVYPRSILQQLTGDYTYSGNASSSGGIGGGMAGVGVNMGGVNVGGGGGSGKEWVPEPGCGLKILDLRPRSAAMANRTAGYGYENTSNYYGTTLQFCNVQNIHAVRDSYQKLCNVCNSESTSDVNWNALIEDTKWLAQVRTILAASWEAAYWVHVWRLPVLIHCSHGWDRTSQASCLAQLLLDPYYRTRHGFGVLVEKDFMSFGHPFHLRCAHGEGRNDSKSTSQNDEGQISPIFLQFVDCVYQIVNLHPNAFEFNAQYLLELSFHIYSCRFGSMLCDTEREREVGAQIRQRTYSLWDYLDSKPEFVNPNYTARPGVILMPLPTLLRNVQLWQERHCCFSPKPTSVLSIAGGCDEFSMTAATPDSSTAESAVSTLAVAT